MTFCKVKFYYYICIFPVPTQKPIKHILHFNAIKSIPFIKFQLYDDEFVRYHLCVREKWSPFSCGFFFLRKWKWKLRVSLNFSFPPLIPAIFGRHNSSQQGIFTRGNEFQKSKLTSQVPKIPQHGTYVQCLNTHYRVDMKIVFFWTDALTSRTWNISKFIDILYI